MMKINKSHNDSISPLAKPEKPGDKRLNGILTATGILLVMFVLTVIWLVPRSNDDLYISLAAGRDIMSGKLAAPDNWSFTTNGRVWLNQNWGADLLLYLTHDAFGGAGLLALKFIVLFSCASFLTLLLRRHEIRLYTALFVTAAIMVSMSLYVLLRPYLFALLFIPLVLWLLYKTTKHPSVVWIAVIMTVLWANMHASFIFGLGIIMLWTLCAIISDIVRRERDFLKKKRQLIAGTAAAILLTGLVTPFGFANLSFPFAMVPDGAWQNIQDWRPVWEGGELGHFSSSILCFLIVVSMTALLTAFRLGYVLYMRSRSGRRTSVEVQALQAKAAPGIILFETILAAVSIVMAIRSNRFILIALISVAPFLASQIAWALRFVRYPRIPPVVISCIVFLYSGIIAVDDVRNYDPINPIMNTGTGSLFEKMHYVNESYDPGLVKFINSNGIGGDILIPWDWEGYLRWNCPSLRMFIGGRAQQVYDVKTFDQYLYITGVDVNRYHGQSPGDILNSSGSHLLLVRNGDENTIITALDSGNWAIVYADKGYILFADTNWPETRYIAQRLENDQLVFGALPIAAMSKASFVLSRTRLQQTEKIIAVFSQAFDRNPVWPWGYKIFIDAYARDPGMSGKIAGLLGNRLEYLSGMSRKDPEVIFSLLCRMYILNGLSYIASSLGEDSKAAQFHDAFSNAQNALLDLQQNWRLVVIK